VVFEHPSREPHVEEIDVEPGQALTLRHDFDGAVP